jgi:drug/metabolite transporter (DMT)-like permease
VVYLLALGSAALYGAADFIGGLTTRRSSAMPVVLLSQAAGLILLALILPLLPHASPSRPDLLWGAAAGLTGGIGVVLLYRALAIGTMAVVAPTTAVSAVVIPVAVSVLLGERPSALAVAGIVLAIVSVVLVSSEQTAAVAETHGPALDRKLPAGVGVALAAGIAIGFFFLSLAQTKPGAALWPMFVARIVSVTLFGVLVIAGKRSLRLPAGIAVLSVTAGIIDVLANALYLLATWSGPLSIVVTLSSLYPASTVLLARVVLRERLNVLQIVGVCCALAAVVLIVRGSQ